MAVIVGTLLAQKPEKLRQNAFLCVQMSMMGKCAESGDFT